MSFNLIQDVSAARVAIGTEVPFLQVPFQGVVSAITTGKCELDSFLKGINPICDFLYEKTASAASELTKIPTWSSVIWDVVAVAALRNDDGRYMVIKDKQRRLPTLKTGLYGEEINLSMRCVTHVHRDALLYDLFRTLEDYSK